MQDERLFLRGHEGKAQEYCCCCGREVARTGIGRAEIAVCVGEKVDVEVVLVVLEVEVDEEVEEERDSGVYVQNILSACMSYARACIEKMAVRYSRNMRSEVAAGYVGALCSSA